MTEDLKLSRLESRSNARQAELAVALQRGMLTALPDLAPLQVAARYLPATDAAESVVTGTTRSGSPTAQSR
jgi:hypothetical protein